MIASFIQLVFWLVVIYFIMKIILAWYRLHQGIQLVGKVQSMIHALKDTKDAMEPHIKTHHTGTGSLKICLCVLSGEFHIGVQNQLCELCNCSLDFNAHNVKGALDHMKTEIRNRDEAINKLREKDS